MSEASSYTVIIAPLFSPSCRYLRFSNVCSFVGMKSQICSHCDEKFAGVPCAAPQCNRVYHFRCIGPSDCMVLPILHKSYCPTHVGLAREEEERRISGKTGENAEIDTNALNEAPGVKVKEENRLEAEDENKLAEARVQIWNNELCLMAKDPKWKKAFQTLSGKEKRVVVSSRTRKAIPMYSFRYRDRPYQSTTSATDFVGGRKPRRRKGYLLLLRGLRTSPAMKRLRSTEVCQNSVLQPQHGPHLSDKPVVSFLCETRQQEGSLSLMSTITCLHVLSCLGFLHSRSKSNASY